MGKKVPPKFSITAMEEAKSKIECTIRYKTSDGLIFDSEEKACGREIVLPLVKAMEESGYDAAMTLSFLKMNKKLILDFYSKLEN